MTRIAFAWSGLPDYAARCLRAVCERHPGRLDVVATRPSVPITGMEASLGQAVTWIDGPDAPVSWEGLGLETPALFFRGGHAAPAFRRLGKECRRRGGKVVGLTDASWRGSWRQRLVDPVRHRLWLGLEVDGLFVPGRSGERYARAMGYGRLPTLSGVLGADPDVFGGGGPLAGRPHTMLFVGRLDPIKNIGRLVAAFQGFVRRHPHWMLEICGDGTLATSIPQHPNIVAVPFEQPQRLAERYCRARCLILPSVREPWGVVVHEAALAGCALALSTEVGARFDLATDENSVVFEPADVGAIEEGLSQVAAWTPARWGAAERASRALAQDFGPQRFADAVDAFLARFEGRAA